MPPSMFLNDVTTGNPQIRSNSGHAINSYTAQPSIYTDAEKGPLERLRSESKDIILLHAAIEEPVRPEDKALVEILLNRGVDPQL